MNEQEKKVDTTERRRLARMARLGGAGNMSTSLHEERLDEEKTSHLAALLRMSARNRRFTHAVLVFVFIAIPSRVSSRSGQNIIQRTAASAISVSVPDPHVQPAIGLVSATIDLSSVLRGRTVQCAGGRLLAGCC